MRLAQGHNAATLVRLEPEAPVSWLYLELFYIRGRPQEGKKVTRKMYLVFSVNQFNNNINA